MSEFSLESVRQYMLMRDGQVTNHELVKHFRAWLTHPTQKDISRQKFKEYVNTLATIKQQNGEKYLCLKPQFYPRFEDDEPPPTPPPPPDPEPSLLDEVMASYNPITPSKRPPPSQVPPPIPTQDPPRRQLPPIPSESNRPGPSRSQQPPLPPYRPPPGPAPSAGPTPGAPVYRSPPQMSDFGLPLPSDYGLPQPRQGMFHPPNPPQMYQDPPMNQYSPHFQPVPPGPSGLPGPPVQVGVPPPALPARRESVSSSISRSSSVMSVQNPSRPHSLSQIPSRANRVYDGPTSSSNSSNVSRKNSTEDKENGPDSVDHARPPSQMKQEKISVKERTKTFNRMASEIDLSTASPAGLKMIQNANMGVRRRSSRATGGRSVRGGDESQDSSSISTLDQTAKQWMVKSSQGDYHGLLKMLRDDPRLTKAKDFVSGYTGLHWAAKHGNLDMVKMLAGNYSAPVNVKSHGGYTPLHLAAQFGHQEVFDILVKAYGADQNLRDNSGKKPRQYLVVQEQAMGLSMSSDTFRQLKDRRRQRRQNGGGKASVGGSGGMSRFGSLSVKVKKTTEAFNNYFNRSESDSGPSSVGPVGLPMELIAGGGTGLSSHNSGLLDDGKKMPPPKYAPSSLKKRKSKRECEYRKTSAPATPTDHHRSSIQEESTEDLKRISAAASSSGHRSDSDSEYGFDSGWTPR